MPFYDLIKNNKNAFDSEELNCYQIKTNIMKDPRIKEQTRVSDVSVDNFIIENNKDVINCTRVIMFNMAEKLYPLEEFSFYYIPFIYKNDKKGKERYYLLVKDNKIFFQSKASSFEKDLLHIKNYKNVFVVAKLTPNNPTIVDIIVKNYMVHKEIQNSECMKIISNITSNLKYFIIDVLKSENVNTRNFLKTPEFDKYRFDTILLLVQIIENDKLKYGIDYELDLLNVYKMAEVYLDDIPDLYILNHTKKPVIKYIEHDVLDKKDEVRTVHYCKADMLYDAYGLDFHLLPTKEWINFYGGIKFYEQHLARHLAKPELHTNNECENNPALKEYLASLPHYKKDSRLFKKLKDTEDLEDPEDSKPAERLYRTIQNNITITSSTNNNILKFEPEFGEEKCQVQ